MGPEDGCVHSPWHLRGQRTRDTKMTALAQQQHGAMVEVRQVHEQPARKEGDCRRHLRSDDVHDVGIKLAFL